MMFGLLHTIVLIKLKKKELCIRTAGNILIINTHFGQPDFRFPTVKRAFDMHTKEAAKSVSCAICRPTSSVQDLFSS